MAPKVLESTQADICICNGHCAHSPSASGPGDLWLTKEAAAQQGWRVAVLLGWKTKLLLSRRAAAELLLRLAAAELLRWIVASPCQ